MEWSPKAVRIRSLSKEEATHGMTFVEEHSPRYVTWIMQKKSEFHWDLGAQSFMPYTSNLWPLKGVQFFPKKSSGHCGLVTKVPSRVIHIFLRDLPNIHFTHTSNCNRGDFLEAKRTSVGNKIHSYGLHSCRYQNRRVLVVHLLKDSPNLPSTMNYATPAMRWEISGTMEDGQDKNEE